MKRKIITAIIFITLLTQTTACAEAYKSDANAAEAAVLNNSKNTSDMALASDIIYDEDSAQFKVPDDMYATPSMQSHLERLNKNLECDIQLNIGSIQVPLEKSRIADMTDKNTGAIDFNKLYRWCKYFADSYGSGNTFRTWNGAVVAIPKGDYTVKETFTAHDISEKVYPALLSFQNVSVDLTPALGNQYIECDLTNQKIYWYLNGKCMLNSNCVTGKKSTPTPSGTYSIKNILGRTRLRGATWDTYVNYWSAFYKGCGLHDATWQSSFGLERWQAGYGSHGCINLPLDVASKMGSYMTVGEPIIVYYR